MLWLCNQWRRLLYEQQRRVLHPHLQLVLFQLVNGGVGSFGEGRGGGVVASIYIHIHWCDAHRSSRTVNTPTTTLADAPETFPCPSCSLLPAFPCVALRTNHLVSPRLLLPPKQSPRLATCPTVFITANPSTWNNRVAWSSGNALGFAMTGKNFPLIQVQGGFSSLGRHHILCPVRHDMVELPVRVSGTRAKNRNWGIETPWL